MDPVALSVKGFLVILAAAGTLAAGAAQAQDVLKDKGCLKCHDMEKKKAGPSFKDLSAKHKGGADTAAIVAKMKEGKGHPKVAGSDEELAAAVKQSLSAK